MIGAQKKLIIAIAVALAVLGIAYFAVIKPVVMREDVVTTEPIVTVDGEIIGASDRIQLFEQVARADMQSIEVHNQHGDYKFVRDATDKFVIEGHESTLYDAQLFSQLVVDCGYTLSKTKILDGASADLYKYGLDPASDPAYYLLTTLTGRTYKVFVGNQITTGGGYYVMLDGRDTVYALDTTLSSTVLQPVEAFVTPLLAYPTSLTTYYLVDNFSVFHGEELFASFKYLEENERSELNTYSVFSMLYPGESYYCPSGYLDTALQSFVNFEGSEVVKLGNTEEASAEFFPDGAVYGVYLANKVLKDQNDESAGYLSVENYLIFSKLHVSRDGEAYYYCYSSMFDIIAKVPDYKAEFLTWDLKLWVNDTIYQLQIDNVAEMVFETPDNKVSFLLSGSGADLVVTEKETEHKPIVKNFRQLYKTILSVNKEGYHNLTDEELAELTADGNKPQLTLTVSLRSGKELVYRFYTFSDRRSYYTINNVRCEFYVLRTSVAKLASDVVRVTLDETVNSEDKY